MKSKSAVCLLAIVVLTFAALWSVPSLAAQESAAAENSAAVATSTLVDVVAGLLSQHTWASTALAIFGALSVVYNALITYAHQRAAATADLDDDKWIASLEEKRWFRILDRIFYFGGYLGAKLGGRKL